ncbi:hypothetical protein [Streptomyces rimosus]|uniref:hypothetical protein n=1 Tax=Streptomyces rimosus TaxID=1927 RepID=UPI001F477202|nr:hypothetical protein [Streptomyces rimosus]
MHLPQRGQRRFVLIGGQVRQDEPGGGGRGDAVDQRHRENLVVAQVHVGELGRHLAQQVRRVLDGQRVQRLGVARQVGEARQPAACDARMHRPAVPRYARQRRDRPRQVVRAAQQRLPGEGGVAGGPVRQPARQLGQLELRRLAVGRPVQGPHRVCRTDQPVRQSREEPRQQARPPAGKHVAPRGAGQFPCEQPLPVAGPVERAERRPPGALVVGVERETGGGRLVVGHRDPVALHPPGHLPLAPEHRQRLGAHRPVVGQVHASASFVPQVVHALQGFVDRIVIADRRHAPAPSGGRGPRDPETNSLEIQTI